MESLIRAIISAVFVGFVVLAVILFILAITAPSELFLRRLGKANAPQPQVVTSTETTIIERERVIEQKPPDTEGILQRVRELIGGREQSQPQQQLPPSPPPPPPPPTNFTLVEMTVEDNRFSPNRIDTVVGNVVHIKLTAVGKTYDIEIPAYGLKQQIKTGETRIIEFQATMAGESAYRCTICSAPVEGTLVVKAQE